jgi:hypothetical protein
MAKIYHVQYFEYNLFDSKLNFLKTESKLNGKGKRKRDKVKCNSTAFHISKEVIFCQRVPFTLMTLHFFFSDNYVEIVT